MYKRVAVIGCGMMGKNHVRIYKSMPNVEVVAICDTNLKLLNETRKLYNIDNYFIEYKEMLKKVEIDYVSVVVPTSLHYEVAGTCLRYGVDVLLEKPIASTIQESQDLINIAKFNKRILAIGHIERFNPVIIELDKRLKSDQLGKIYKIDIDRVGPYPVRIRDVGVVIDLAVHDLDILNFLTDSKSQTLNSMTHKHINTNNEDLLDATIRYENGVIGHININWLTPTKIRQLKVLGEKGMFVLDYIEQTLKFYKNGKNFIGLRPETVIEGEIIQYYIKKEEPLKIELTNFINSMVIVTGEEGQEALRQALELIK